VTISAREHAEDIPSQRHHVDPVIRLVENQRSRPTRCIPQVNPYHLRKPGISRKSDRCEDERDPDIAKEHPPVLSNLNTVEWSLSQSGSRLKGQEKEDAW
jgi:hypothetical protein